MNVSTRNVKRHWCRARSRFTAGGHSRHSFIVIFLAEWGDLTQILTANLAARYHSPVSVGLGAVLSFWSVAAIAVAGGQTLLRVVNVMTVRFVTAVVLTVLAGYTAWLAIR